MTRSDPLTVIFCLPGNTYSGAFLRCWSELLEYCLSHGIRPLISQQSSCNVYYVRNKCLGGDVRRGGGQKPFNGALDYDYLMWIDSDIVFRPHHFQRLLDDRLPIVAGLYLMESGAHFATVQTWDEHYFAEHGTFRFLSPTDIEHKDEPFTVAYTGMGFMLVQCGVFEAMAYPWFRPIAKRVGKAVDFTMEDVAFCLTSASQGVNVAVDPRVRVGHEKRVVL